MKNFLKTLLALTLATAFLLTGCDMDDISGENSSNISDTSSEVLSATVQAECEQILSAFSDSMLLCNSFHSTGGINIVNLVTWYGYRLQAQGVDFSPYMVDGWEGSVFPAEEIEPVIYDFFGLEKEYLRDSEAYVYDLGGYPLPNALFKLAENSYQITDAEVSGNVYTIYFNFTVNENAPEKCMLVAEKDGDKIRFISYGRKIDFTTDDIDPIFKTEYSKMPLTPTEEDLKYLEIQASILTEQLVLSSINLDNRFDKNEINRFFGLLTKFEDNPDYRYAPIIRESQDLKYSLFCFEDVNRTTYEIFGVREWTFASHLLDIDREHKVYAADFGYGINMPYFSADYETTVTDPFVEVEFTLYRRGSKDGDPHEFDEGRYIARYNVMKDEAGAFLRFKEFEKKYATPEVYKLEQKKGEITNCTPEETSEYLKTDEAKKLATFFGMCINEQSFLNPIELMDKTSYAFFWFMQDTMLDIGTTDANADVVAVKKSTANEYLEKYFDIENFDPKDYEFYNKYSGEYHFPHPAGKTMWIVQDIELESIEQNECTFRYVYSYVTNEPPYWSARITFKVMKDKGGAFLQVVSCTDVNYRNLRIEQAKDALYKQDLEWQSITCEIPTIPARFVTEDGYKRLEIPKTDGNKAVTFKLPKGFYPTENSEGNVGKTWTDGKIKINISCVYKVDPTEYLDYEKSIWPDPYVRRRTFLDDGIVDTILYPRIKYEDDNKNYADDEPSARSHFACIDCGDVIVSFEVSEPWYIDTPTMTKETLSMIKTIADSFE